MTKNDFNILVQEYVNSLNEKFREKYLLIKKLTMTLSNYYLQQMIINCFVMQFGATG